MLLHLSEFSELPLHRQISRQLLERIVRGDLSEGSSLTSNYGLAKSHKVSVKTVDRAYRDLEDLGLIKSKDAGYRIASLTTEQRQRFSARNPVSLQTEHTASTFSEELSVARNIQTDYLPKVLPSDEQVTLAASYSASNLLGGDLYDFLPLDENRFGIVIADACGKGVPGALLISQVQALVRNEAKYGSDIGRALRSLNQQLHEFTPKDKFVTLFYGIYDKTTGEFEYASAGHNSPVLVRRDGETNLLETGGPALGVLADATYATGKVRLQAGDSLVLYTDGVTETMNRSRQEYGEQRLVEVLRRHRFGDPQKIVDAILADLNGFRNGVSQQDDQTMLVLKVGQLGVNA